MSDSPKNTRLAYIDHLRVFTIALVVIQHAAVTYSGLGSWYYNEPSKLGQGSFLFFGVWQSHAQAFFMSLFFLLAGYFVPAALTRKGPWAFVRDRLFRLGVPLLAYVFVIHPLIVKLLNPTMDLAGFYGWGLRTLDIVSWTGPLWFAEALLILTLACVPFARWLKPRTEEPVTPLPARWLWLAIAVTTAGAFGIRLIYPVGTAVANLQFCYFSAYVVTFAAGVIAGTCRGFERIDARAGKRWLAAAFGLGLPLWLVAVVTGGALEGQSGINGGWRLSALLYALWESFFCVAFIVALLGIAREKFNFQTPWMRFLADNTFGVYVFHALVLVLVSLALKPLDWAAVPKFSLVSLIALGGSFLFAWVVRLLPPLRRVFS
jgi:peptidoglycan/LPS O-acetylase OafA/YrhL